MNFKKNALRTLSCLGTALMLSTSTLLPAFAADDEVTTMATTAPLNMRDATGTYGNVITTIPEGTSVEVFSMTYDGWYNIKYNGQLGYCYYVYLDFEGTESGAVNDGRVTTMYATAPLNIRQSPSTDSAVLATLSYDEGVDVYAKHDGWFSVQYNGMDGYCNGAYLNFGQAGKAEDTVGGNVMNMLTVTAPLNVRTEPSTNGAILGSFQAGESVKVIGVDGDWYKVEFGDQIGYAHGDYFQ